MGATGMIGIDGARLPGSPRPAVADVTQGFLFEVLRYPAPHSRRPAPVQAPRVVPTAREVVRAIRLQVRTAHVLGMTPREVERAVEWAESGWRVALALLDAGEPCGFTVVLGSEAVVEWTARPVRCLELRIPAAHHHRPEAGT